MWKPKRKETLLQITKYVQYVLKSLLKSQTGRGSIALKWANGRSSVESKYRKKIEARTGSYENQAPVRFRLHDKFNWECTNETQKGLER